MIIDRLQKSARYAEFKKDCRDGNLSHAYLVLGEDKLAREVYMRLIAMTLLCKQGACGECPVCEKIAAGVHSDVKKYNADSKMSVRDAENLVSDTYIGSWEGGYKLYFLDNAESLSPAVQNKLLKVYEEPTDKAIIFLFASGEAGILQTIQSRAKKIYLPVFGTEAICAELEEEGVPHRNAEIASVLSGGRFDRAFKFSEDEGYIAQYERAFEILLKCKKSNEIAEYILDDVFSKDSISVTLEFFEIILRDVLVKISGSNAEYMTLNRDYDLGEIARGFTEGGVAMALLAIAKGRKMLTFNISSTTVAENVLFNVLEAKYKWQ